MHSGNLLMLDSSVPLNQKGTFEEKVEEKEKEYLKVKSQESVKAIHW